MPNWKKVIVSGSSAHLNQITGSGGVKLADDAVLNIGDENDLQLYHDGSNSYIKDNGTGMSDEIISKCREPFFTTKINSLGLGLSIADNLLKAVGGDSQVSSKGKFGSEITIYLPQKINA